jgi:dihydrofolate reductase
MTKISLIVAAAENNVIGKDNKMPWHIPADFKHFKEITLGKPCIMGRKTYESILDQLGKPLPGRTSLVISRSDYRHEGCQTFGSLEDAIEAAKSETNDEVMIIGGAQIYKMSIPLADRIYLTKVHQSPEGDAFFSELDDNWKEVGREDHHGYSFLTLERIKN